MDIMIQKNLRRKIRNHSKKWFPKEFFCFLTGKVTKTAIWLDDIWIPPDLDSHTGKDSVDIPMKWWEQAADEGFLIVGDYHTHPDWYTCAISEADQDHIQSIKPLIGGPFVVGIGGVYRHKETKKVKCRTRFWPYA